MHVGCTLKEAVKEADLLNQTDLVWNKDMSNREDLKLSISVSSLCYLPFTWSLVIASCHISH
jgi:hypothetical protein